MSAEDRTVRNALLEFLKGGSAHADISAAIKNFPPALYGKKPAHAPHTAWQLVEHIRITLDDLYDFCTNPDYREREWPDNYWPKTDAPDSEDAWAKSIKHLKSSLKQLEQLLDDSKVDLYARIPWGKDQTILREVLLAGDHTSYHVGQLVMLRRELDAWKG